jgi:hypothetical protein
MLSGLKNSNRHYAIYSLEKEMCLFGDHGNSGDFLYSHVYLYREYFLFLQSYTAERKGKKYRLLKSPKKNVFLILFFPTLSIHKLAIEKEILVILTGIWTTKSN